MHPEGGPEPLQWKRSRCFNTKNSRGKGLITPAMVISSPQSDGPQACPDCKFLENKSLTMSALLMQDHKLKIVKKDGESEHEAKKRAVRIVNDMT